MDSLRQVQSGGVNQHLVDGRCMSLIWEQVTVKIPTPSVLRAKGIMNFLMVDNGAKNPFRPRPTNAWATATPDGRVTIKYLR